VRKEEKTLIVLRNKKYKVNSSLGIKTLGKDENKQKNITDKNEINESSESSLTSRCSYEKNHVRYVISFINSVLSVWVSSLWNSTPQNIRLQCREQGSCSLLIFLKHRIPNNTRK